MDIEVNSLKSYKRLISNKGRRKSSAEPYRKRNTFLRALFLLVAVGIFLIFLTGSRPLYIPVPLGIMTRPLSVKSRSKGRGRF